MKIEFTLVGNATWILNIDNRVKIGCDPALAPSGNVSFFKGSKIERVISPVYKDETFKAMDLWLLTHNHFDHIDSKGIKVIENHTDIVSIDRCKPFIKSHHNVTYLNWSETVNKTIKDYSIEIKGIPAFHGKGVLGRIIGGKVNGYLITIIKKSETKVVYITSDSIYDRQIKEVIGDVHIDLMVINMGKVKSQLPGGPYTADIPTLETFKTELEPQKILPIHIDDYSHFETTKEELNRSWDTLNNGETVTIFNS